MCTGGITTSMDTCPVLSLLSLPDEILLFIISFLPSRECLSVKSTCRRLQLIASDPSVWHTIAWQYRGPQDDKQLTLALKLSAPQLSKCTLAMVTDYSCAPSKFLQILKRSSTIASLTIIGCQFTCRQFNAILSTLPHIEELKVQLSFTSKSAVIDAIEFASHLKSLVIMMPYPVYYSPLDQILLAWANGTLFCPPDIGVQFSADSYHKMPLELIAECLCCLILKKEPSLPPTAISLSILSYLLLSPAPHTARLCIYNSPSAFSSLPEYPSLALEFGPSKPPVMPVAQLDCIGLEEDGHLFLTGNELNSSNYHSGTLYKMPTPHIVPCAVSSIPSSLTHLFLDQCTSLNSTNLEVIAEQCPVVVRLSLCGCTSSLKDLEGLGAIAAKCSKLKDLSLLQIHRRSVPCTGLLWEVVSHMHLTCLAVDACMLRPLPDADSRGSAGNPERVSRVPIPSARVTDQIRSILRAMTSLAALEVNCSCSECLFLTLAVSLVSEVSYLEYLRLDNLSSTLLSLNYFENIRHLKYLYLSKHIPGKLVLPSSETFYSDLEQLCIDANATTLNLDIITSITSGRKITHAFLSVRSIDEKCILHLIQNSPRLLVLYVKAAEKPRRNRAQYIVKALNKVAKSRGVVNFSIEFGCVGFGLVSGVNVLVHSKLLSLF